jgi:hypothetical protein
MLCELGISKSFLCQESPPKAWDRNDNMCPDIASAFQIQDDISPKP